MRHNHETERGRERGRWGRKKEGTQEGMDGWREGVGKKDRLR